MTKVIYRKQGLDCLISYDDITTVKADAVVTSESQYLGVDSLVTLSLMEKIATFREKRREFKDAHKCLALWTAVPSHFGDTFNYVIHAVIINGNDEEWIQNMITLYHRVFSEAEELRTATIALPLLGTGVLCADQCLAVRALVDSVLSYSPRGHLSVIVVSKDVSLLVQTETQFMNHQFQDKKIAKDSKHSQTMSPQTGNKVGNTSEMMAAWLRSRMEQQRKVDQNVQLKYSQSQREIEGAQRKRKYNMEPGQFSHKTTSCSTSSSLQEDYNLHSPRKLSKSGITQPESMLPFDRFLRSEGITQSESTLSFDRFLRSEDQNNQQRYNKYIHDLQNSAQKKGLTMRDAGSETDIFSTLSDQLTSVLGEEMEQGNLRTIVAGYLRREQNRDNSLEPYLMETSLDELLTAVVKEDNVDSHIIISAVCNAMNVEVLLLAASRGEIQEVLFQPFREKEFLPTLVIGTISRERFISFEHLTYGVPPDVPATWSQRSKDTELVTLLPESAEFQEVQHSFLRSIGRLTYNVLQIKRVQSSTLWDLYKSPLRKMAQRYPDMTSERRLWHGTSAESIHPICKEGFNRSFCGKNGTLHGEGTYFSRAPGYAAADVYSVPGSDGFKYMFRARVLTGRYTKGQIGMKVPPWFDEKDMIRFDYVVDDVDKPNLFVIFHDAKAYPEYLIKFIESYH